MKYILLFIFLMFTELAFADIYMLTDKNGNITYTDIPEKGAQKVEVTVPPLHDSPVTAPSIENGKSITLSEPGQKKPYKIFAISSPINEGTVRNEPNIMIMIAIEPGLQVGDKIQIFVDEKPAGNPAAETQIGIGRLDRGMHQVKAAIIDANQKILKISPAITIYVHYGIANKTS